ncbi:unnamed protein product, partial [Brenthis ino]
MPGEELTTPLIIHVCSIFSRSKRLLPTFGTRPITSSQTSPPRLVTSWLRDDVGQVLTKQTFHGHTSPTHIATQGHSGRAAPHTALSPGARGAAPEAHRHTKIRRNHQILAAQIHGKAHKTGAVRSGTWRGRGAAHAPASILVRPPRGYHCNMAATHFLGEVLR